MSRRSAREVVLHLIFSHDFLNNDADELLENRLSGESFASLSDEYQLYEQLPAAAQIDYVQDTVRGIIDHAPELDAYIEKYAVGWNVGRLSRITRAVLRLCMYETLYLQTGLGRAALDEMKDDPERILTFQDALFYDGDLAHEEVAVTTKRDIFADTRYRAPMVDLQDGDVLITSTCHSFGWRNGHAALVVNGTNGSLLESVSLGIPSTITTYGSDWFCYGTNFMVLRLKDAGEEARAEIAQTARERLYNVPYSLTVGFLSPKDQGETPQGTHCSHLVWQAYHYFGYDIDSDGGPLCTTQDISRSDLFEVVQVFGFDPVKLW